MGFNLEGKTAIVTGGSAGIGLAIAKKLHAEGVHVLIAARDEERLRLAKEAITNAGARGSEAAQVIAIQADLSEADNAKRIIDAALDAFGRVDILINNAGSAKSGAFLELTDKDFTDTWNLKLLGYIRTIRAVLPQLIKQGDGRIVNIIGTASRTPSPTFLPGGTTNAALLNFSKGIARELAPQGIRLNVISPGLTETGRAEELAVQQASAKGISLEDYKAQFRAAIPIGRAVYPDEVADLALFLVSDQSASISGAEVVIDGGHQPGL
ncbi:short-chain dehydrogenase/reductase SDR [Paenibacillus curdlanolyticus YK9]|uniref:Short-chain dehydrogenase/reductase SDR n=1 Tax=Paenibacillus curdlanolyticus YK9 TaxID=717606 RepID=E0I9L3_9BACL|nr:SDR family oxidoreductase [Paenibacillus curdlanolyticus]EFM11097.1 short-chain dehydrogenase/reductase SDR [Paenibacillus curdlanolyticus YK9]